MAKSEIRVNADAFVKSLNQQQLVRHQGIMESLQNYIDRALVSASSKHIIRGKFGPSFPRRAMYRLQPTNKTRLTTRTGLLHAVLSMNMGWNPKRTSKIMGETRMKSHPYIKAWVRPQSSGTSFFYLIRLSLSGDAEIEYRINHEKRGDKRGVKRPFLTPGLEDSYKPTEAEIKQWQQRNYRA